MNIKIVKRRKQSKFYFIDLFCGAGGLSCGLEMAGLECVLGADIDKDAIETFKLNHPNAQSFLGPIAKLDKETLMSKIGKKKIKLIAGGPPCQGFSTIGKGDPKDKKNSLFIHYCRILKIINPEYFVFENVTGLLAAKNRIVLNAILDEFSKLGYRVNVKVLEAQHYGVPQKRRRTILYGTRLSKSLAFPSPSFDIVKSEKYISPRTVGDALSNLANHKGEILNHNLKVAKIDQELTWQRIKCIPQGRGIRYKEDEEELLPDHLKLDVDWKKIKEGRLRELKLYRLDSKKPSPTVNTKPHNYFHPFQHRRFTARECASIQSFPNDFVFAGSTTAQLKQIGNAVPPLLAKALGLQILKSHRNADLKKCNTQSSVLIEHLRSGAFVYNNAEATST
ncbi:MAG: DNA cytosine methyltransferase [Bacteriovoracaceae bacterium]|nr:DNA cytosine methyltransferase [Bacteriovoracaceae bacterium]